MVSGPSKIEFVFNTFAKKKQDAAVEWSGGGQKKIESEQKSEIKRKGPRKRKVLHIS